MPTQIHSKNTPKNYDAGDMLDAHSLAKADMQWMNTAITHVNKEIKRLHTLAINGETLSQYHFSELITHLEMYEYLADSRYHCHEKEADAYKTEWEANKKAVIL